MSFAGPANPEPPLISSHGLQPQQLIQLAPDAFQGLSTDSTTGSSRAFPSRRSRA